MTKLILYSTDACHLCDIAKQLIWQTVDHEKVTLEEIDIIDDPALFERYQYSIPVLSTENRIAECEWPFDKDDVNRLLESD